MFGLPAWFDVTTSQPARSIEFYMQLFDWTAAPVTDTDYGKYIVFRRDGLPVAGLVERNAGTPQPDGWLSYLTAADLGTTIAVAQRNQGKVQRPILALPEIGDTAVLTDPADSSIGIVRLGPDTKLATDNVGTPVWTEIETVDWPVTFEFMTDTFGVYTETQSATPGQRFSTIHDADRPRGGIFELAADVPHSRWEVAFLIPDIETAIDRAVAHGATVVRPPYNVPVGPGFGARLADPVGAHFNFISF